MNTSSLANALLPAIFFTVFALPALRNPQTRKWVPIVFLIALIDSGTTMLPIIFHSLSVIGHDWNWMGKIFNIAAMLVVSFVLISSRRFTARDIGLTFRQAPGTSRALLTVILPFFVVMIVLTLTFFGNAKPPSLETVLFEASMPGLAEELSYRGVTLAIFNRMFTGRFRFLRADLGYGAIAVSIAFGLIHSVGFDKGMHLQFSWVEFAATGSIGFVLAWLRTRTQSLVLPVVVHNITNLILECVPKVF